jgi:hypothetical protein
MVQRLLLLLGLLRYLVRHLVFVTALGAGLAATVAMAGAADGALAEADDPRLDFASISTMPTTSRPPPKSAAIPSGLPIKVDGLVRSEDAGTTPVVPAPPVTPATAAATVPDACAACTWVSAVCAAFAIRIADALTDESEVLFARRV